MGRLPVLLNSICSSLDGLTDYKTDYGLIVAASFLLYSIARNQNKKLAFSLAYFAIVIAVYDRGWYEQREIRFQGLVFGSLVCIVLLFFCYENILKLLNKNCKYMAGKVWIFRDHEAMNHKNFYGFLIEVKDWIFLDDDQYRNLTSVKFKILMRSLHNFTLLTLLAFFSTFLFNLGKVESSSIVYLVPIFFVIYQYNANQHWNQWKYCVDLYNSIRAGDKDYDERKYALALDMIVLDMWPNRTLYGFFKGVLESAADELGQTEIDLTNISSMDTWNLLTKAHLKAVERAKLSSNSSSTQTEPCCL
ncbi:MAG TPA: hypothetical protein VFO10_29250 [Oligoflexus sp.]|uniref:hypothetical protein n=1 Tax=Oligoflexus sp. TaxID=1971216 RepID=UPI002D7FAFF6|nr:hypothetical protein [Oligoflexus sp.]HET9241389.1 hypothetical protein [Oligoflexus sp.]